MWGIAIRSRRKTWTSLSSPPWIRSMMEAVGGGSLERLLARIKKQSPRRRVRSVDRMLFELRGAEPVDRVFLDYLETYRKHLARAIYHDNRKSFPEANTLHGAARLTEAV